MEVNMYTTIVIGSWVLSPTKSSVFTGFPTSETGLKWLNLLIHATTFHCRTRAKFFHLPLFISHVCQPSAALESDKIGDSGCFLNPRPMKLPATFQPLFKGGEFSDVLWHTEHGMSGIYLHSHPFKLGKLNFWGDFRWVCDGIAGIQHLISLYVRPWVGYQKRTITGNTLFSSQSFQLRSLTVYFAECMGLQMK